MKAKRRKKEQVDLTSRNPLNLSRRMMNKMTNKKGGLAESLKKVNEIRKCKSLFQPVATMKSLSILKFKT